MDPLLRVINLSKRFGRLSVLEKVSFEVYPGEVVGLAGRSGAGKSVLAMLLAGLHTPNEGAVYFDEKRLHWPLQSRRFSIEVIHQEPILAENLDQIHRVKKAKLEDQCKHISIQERKAIDAERESISYKQAEYMANHVGESFIGYISGIIDRGIFVSLADSKCEGLVRFDSMNEGFSVADHRLRAMGLHSGMVYSFGDQVKVRITSADPERREIDMVLDE